MKIPQQAPRAAACLALLALGPGLQPAAAQSSGVLYAWQAICACSLWARAPAARTTSRHRFGLGAHDQQRLAIQDWPRPRSEVPADTSRARRAVAWKPARPWQLGRIRTVPAVPDGAPLVTNASASVDQ
jgi:hypothetical protein